MTPRPQPTQPLRIIPPPAIGARVVARCGAGYPDRTGVVVAVEAYNLPTTVRNLLDWNNPRTGQHAVTIAWDAPEDHLDTRNTWDLSPADNTQRIGIYFRPDLPAMPPAEVAERLVICRRAEVARQIEREQGEAKQEADRQARERAFAAARPAWASHMIVAEYHEDESDSQSDYFASRTTRRVVIAWSRHGRDLFAEMRKAAAEYEPTRHMGPGHDRYTPRVVYAADCRDPHTGQYHYAGEWSRGHSDIQENPDTGRLYVVHAEAEARAIIATKGEPYTVDGIAFTWKIERESYEHREKYSMGHGYYLADGGSHSTGWHVCKNAATRGGEYELAPHLASDSNSGRA